VRLPARGVQVRTSTARRHRVRHRPAGRGAGGHGCDPRGDGVPEGELRRRPAHRRAHAHHRRAARRGRHRLHARGLTGPLSAGTLFEDAARGQEPLAVRMRPRTLDEVVGQNHLTGPGTPLRLLVDGDGTTSVLLWGPPGTGKTTLAYVVAGATGRVFRELS